MEEYDAVDDDNVSWLSDAEATAEAAMATAEAAQPEGGEEEEREVDEPVEDEEEAP